MLKDRGYVALTQSKKKVLITLKRQRYVADLAGVREVLDGKRGYTLIFEPSQSCKAEVCSVKKE